VLPEETAMPTRSGHTTAILTSKVVGTPVFAASGEKLGHVQDIMLDKMSDRLAFAVMASNRSDCAMQRFLPIPWALLDYDAGKQGYLIGLSEQQLKNAPMFDLEELTAEDGARARIVTHKFYNAI
jgi:sporulation protein YlmC with PRC-barrel domain